MFKEKKVKLVNYIVPAILFVAIVLCTIKVISINRENRATREMALKENVLYYKNARADLKMFHDYANVKYDYKYNQETLKKTDLEDLDNKKFNVSHISMWDLTELDEDWYYVYFATPMKYVRYIVSTPQELAEMLNASVTSGDMNKVAVSIDPYALWKNYYKSVYYENETLPYEEYFTTYILPVFEENSDIAFDIFLPEISYTELSKMSENELDAMLANWYTFLMWLHWYPNVRVAYIGAEDWVAENESSFISKYDLNDDVSKLAHLYLYAYDEYTVTPPELEEAGEKLKELINQRNEDITKHRDDKIVFYGDSMLAYTQQESISIPGIIENITGAKVYDLSIGGTNATFVSEKKDSFAEVAGSPVGRDADRFATFCKEDDALTFVIWYGTNDYFENVDIDDYIDALNGGIDSIKARYKNASFVIVGPYQVAAVNEEKDILEYVEAAKEVAEKQDAVFVNMYEESGITLESESLWLTDSVHPKLNTNVYLASIILKNLLVEKNY